MISIIGPLLTYPAAIAYLGSHKRVAIAVLAVATADSGFHRHSFDGTGSILGGTMKRLQNLTGSKDSRLMLYLALFVVVVFLLIYKLSRP